MTQPSSLTRQSPFHFRVISAPLASLAALLNSPLRGAVRSFIPVKDPRVFHVALALAPLALWLRTLLLRSSRMSSQSLLSNKTPSAGVIAKAGAMLCPCFCPPVDHRIFRACESPDGMEAVRAVIKKDPQAVHKRRRDDQATPLHVAAVLQDPDLVRLLLSNNAEAGAVDKDGRTALHVAALSGNADLVGVLVDSLPAPALDSPTKNGHTALFLACWRGHLEVAQLLHGRGASENKIDAEGKSMIDRARGWNQTRVVAWLSELRDRTLAPPAIPRPDPSFLDPETDQDQGDGALAG